MAIRTELVLQRVATFDLIGGSWGGLMAHQIAIAARRISFAPRRLVLLDPLPPLTGAKPNVMPVPLRQTFTILVVTILAAARAEGLQDASQEIQRGVL